ncbi:MAG: MarR family transcriptional regulator [Pseudomonadota bacterium]
MSLSAGANTPASDADIQALIELLFFAYRDFTSDPDALLDAEGMGRAHHRVLHFVNRNPGMRVADLLDILRITKQSLGRVLRQLVERGYIEQREGPQDRRERRLYATAAGAEFAAALSQPQSRRFHEAFQSLPPGAAEQAQAFLMALVNRENRRTVLGLIAETGTPSDK